MLVSPFHIFKKISYRNAKGYNPKISVIIPAWNEEVGIMTTVNSLLESKYRNLEVIVINDGSTDGSDRMLTAFQKEYNTKRSIADPTFKYKYKENGGKGRALNTGIELATGEIIMSIDADCYVEDDAVGNFAKVFSDPKVMAAVGNVRIGNTDTILGVIQYLEFLFSFYFKKADSVLNSIYIVGGAAGAFRREIFENLGGYNVTNITEDIELSMRVQDAGHKIVYVDDALIYTEGATTFKGLLKQRLRWKRGRFETFSQYSHMFFSFDSKHSFILSWIILPFALFAEIQMFCEPIFLIILYVYSIMTSDFTSFISGILVVSCMFYILWLFDNLDRKSIKKTEYLVLAPIGWLLFYVSTIVEFNALIKSVWGIIFKKEITWQKWNRVGVGPVK
jgi:cellulose synthase/poly-beta-1,6-N-acetylglucosamine synthase-like glycosyltransferase